MDKETFFAVRILWRGGGDRLRLRGEVGVMGMEFECMLYRTKWDTPLRKPGSRKNILE